MTTLFPLTTFGQNPHDSLTVIYKSDNLIEFVKPLIPEIEKRTEPKSNTVLDGSWIDTKKYDVLKNGEINVYDRFYQLIEHIVYRDSVRIIEENYKNGILTYQSRHIPEDITFIYTYYDDNGKMKMQGISTPKSEKTTKWHDNGFLKSICINEDNQQKCDNWDDKGLYKNGILTVYKGNQDVVISEIEIDKDGKEIRKIR